MVAINYISPIDPHVHLRGEEYDKVVPSYSELAARDAQAVGLIAVIEQPNPKPWLTSPDAIKSRLEQQKKIWGDIIHRAHIGLTTDETQVRSALEGIIQGKHHLVSDKTFYVHSTGNMGILDPDYQRRIWMIKGEMGYQGVSIGHFEDEKEYIPIDFDPTFPVTHSIKQHRETELIQVMRQIRNARDAKFKGTFYIAHVSNPDTIEFIKEERRSLPFEVAIEMTWHHMLLNWDDYALHGNRVKMNPALRGEKVQERLFSHALEGDVDVMGSDHAPHPRERKDSPVDPPSGIQALPIIPLGIQIFQENGIDEILLAKMLFHNSNRIFKMGLTPRRVSVEYNPSLWKAYGYNPFSRIDGTHPKGLTNV